MFLDDGMGGHADFIGAVQERNELYNLLCKLGFRLSTKSSPLPEQTKLFLGLIVHTASAVLELSTTEARKYLCTIVKQRDVLQFLDVYGLARVECVSPRMAVVSTFVVVEVARDVVVGTEDPADKRP